MPQVDTKMTTAQLMQLAADHSNSRVTLSDDEKELLVLLLKQRGAEELDYGQEIECENVRLIKRVTGAIGLYFK
ncbi:MAG TPA: hypothetical protein V6D08_20555 [Candidatus Obscuribacterales bacterium]